MKGKCVTNCNSDDSTFYTANDGINCAKECGSDEYILNKVCTKCSTVFADCTTCDMAATKCTSCLTNKALTYSGSKCVDSCSSQDGGNKLSLNKTRCVKDCASEDGSILDITKTMCVT